MSGRGVVLFHTSSAAIRAEKALVKAGMNVKLIPTPREFSSDCGIALAFDWTQRDLVRELLSQGGVETAATHELPLA